MVEKFSGNGGNGSGDDGNGRGGLSTMELIAHSVKLMTPEADSFTKIYPKFGVKADQELLSAVRKSPDYKKIDEDVEDSFVLEKSFIDFASQDDWFSEEELYGDDPDAGYIQTIPTNDIDDVFGHIDLISVFSNETTNHRPLPFAIDVTTSSRSDVLAKKFGWVHTYGKSKDAPFLASEFGSIVAESNGERVKLASLKDRRGLKLPGFASAKYFEDTGSLSEPMLPKGRINLMPRFVVGLSKELAETLRAGKPDRQDYATVLKYDKREIDEWEAGYKRAVLRMRCCTLMELTSQAKHIETYLKNLPSEAVKTKDPKELATAREQIKSLRVYFDNALQASKEKAEKLASRGDFSLKFALDRAEADQTVNAVIFESERTYLGGAMFSSRKAHLADGRT